jgi:hypothetical protein
MAYVVRFAPNSMTEAQYDECIKQLKATGNFPAPGMDYHVCFRVDGKLHVSDIWNSKEEFELFGETLMPILNGLGIDAGQPTFLEVHNQIKG